MPTHHPYIPDNPFNHLPGDNNPIRNYDPGVFGGLPTNEQAATIRNMSKADQADLLRQLTGLEQGYPQTKYSNQIGDLFYSLLGLAGYGGGGGGGRGGGGGGGGVAIDLGPQLGLERDKINAEMDHLNASNNNRIGSAMIQQLMMNLQKKQAKQQFKSDTNQFLGSEAARGANTTGGANTGWHDLNRQFRQAMQNQGWNQNLFDIQNGQGNADYFYNVQQGNFGKQGLDIQANQAGYQNPFNIPGPVPVQKKAV